jgi:hypothetical protein
LQDGSFSWNEQELLAIASLFQCLICSSNHGT